MLGIFLTACGEEDSGSKEDASEVVANKEITNIEQARGYDKSRIVRDYILDRKLYLKTFAF